MSSFCKNCGTEIKTGGLFCPKCGCKVGERVANSNVNSGTIATRQSTVPVATKENIATGEDIRQSVQGASRGEARGNNSLAINVGLGILSLAVIGVGTFFFAFDGDVNKVRAILPGNSQTKVETTVKHENTGNASKVEQKTATQDDKIADFVSQKDKLDVEIAGVASDVNNYLKGHSDFRGNDAERLISDAKRTLDRVERAQDDLKQLPVKPENQAVKDTLLRVLDCEAGRIRGLYKGMLDSKNNGDYMIGFKEGTDHAYKYDDENAKFNSLYKK